MSLHRYNVGNHRLDPGGRDRSRQSDKSKAFKVNSIDGDPSARLTRATIGVVILSWGRIVS
eukprot:COSAG01_NODE_30895_length_607_cov_3.588583_1_plen_60_part_10